MKPTILMLALSFCSCALHAQNLISDEKSLNAAINKANMDSSMTKIAFAIDAKISLTAPVIYSGKQNLTLIGNNAVIDGAKAGSFKMADDLTATTQDSSLIFNSAGALKISDLSIINSATRGLTINIPKDATGTDVSIILHNIKVTNSALYGLHIDDNADEFDEGDIGSAVGINLVIEDSEFVRNGTGAIDFDGVRVDERGHGNISAFITKTIIDENGGDGIELDEAGAGNVEVEMVDVSLSRNGFYNKKDLDDGFDIDEAGDGDINASLINVVIDANLDEGLDFDESGKGDLITRMYHVSANRNSDEGLKFDEEGDGDIRTILSNVSVSKSGDDGIQLTELGEGLVSGTLSQVSISDSEKLGLKAQMWVVEDEQAIAERAGSLQLLDLKLSNNAKGDQAVHNLLLH
jgi:hypothetical protein